MATVYDYSAKTIDGAEQSLGDYRGKAMLIVNVASKCGFTPQYEGLEQMYRRHKDQGLVVLGFPCDQFGHQEPGNEEEIRNFCALQYDVSFPMYSKIDVNGADAHPLFEWLKSEKPGLLGGRITWNFTKFLVGRDGQVVARYSPSSEPAELAGDVRAALAAPGDEEDEGGTAASA